MGAGCQPALGAGLANWDGIRVVSGSAGMDVCTLKGADRGTAPFHASLYGFLSLPSDPVQALALLRSVFPTTAPPWISCRNKCAGSGMPVLAVTSMVSGRKPTASHDSPLPAWLFTFSSPKISTFCCVLPWGKQGTNPLCVQGLLSSFPSLPTPGGS